MFHFIDMKLSDWAKKQGISYRTAWRWFNEGKLPVEAEQAPTGTILIKEVAPDPLQVAIYARVSSSDQKNDLDRQIKRRVMEIALGLLEQLRFKERRSNYLDWAKLILKKHLS